MTPHVPRTLLMSALFFAAIFVVGRPDAAYAKPAADSLDVRLLFDGKPLPSKNRARFSCFSYSAEKWFNCGVRPTGDLQTYRMRRPAPGQYRMHINIDDNEDNPDSYAGDFALVHRFDIQKEGPNGMEIDVPRLIHLTTPIDNGRSVEGAFAACDRPPDYTIPFLTWPREAEAAFTWEPVAPNATYHVVVWRVRCDPYGRIEPFQSFDVQSTSFVFRLPRSGANEHYQFVVKAEHDGRPVGDFQIHDAGTYGWDYRFRVALEEPNPRIAVVASLGAICIFFLVSLAFMLRTGQRSMAAASLLVVVVSGWLGFQAYAAYRKDHRQAQEQILEARKQNFELQQSIDDLFLAEWNEVAPKPDWWNEVTPPDYPIDNVGELFSAWQSDFGRGETRILRERQFFKGAMLAIQKHPGDRELTSTAIDLMAFIGRDYAHRRAMLEFAVKHFFDHERSTGNCADCLPGDRTNSFVGALAKIHLRASEYQEAIDLIERFATQRRREVSDSQWAETNTFLAEAYWAAGRRTKAIEVLESEGSIAGDHPYVVRMRERLAEYKAEMSRSASVEARPLEPVPFD